MPNTHRPTNEQTMSTSSRLLALPPELRNYVYELSLGGNTIHVRLVGGEPDMRYIGPAEFQYGICTATESDNELVSTFAKVNDDNETLFEDYEDRYSACQTGPPHYYKFPFQLLQTCRQIYNEARPFPFAYNTFSFEEDWEVESFEAQMSSEALKQIKSIILSGSTLTKPILCGQSQFISLTKIQIFKTLPGRENCCVEGNVWHIPDKSIYEYESHEEYEKGCRIAGSLKKFDSATVCIHYGTRNGKGHPDDPFSSFLPRKLSRELEALLT